MPADEILRYHRPIEHNSMHIYNNHLLNQKKLLLESIEEIKNPLTDFTSRYFAVGYIQSIAEKDPDIITEDVINVLAILLKNEKFAHERRGFFLFRLASETLRCIIINDNGHSMGKRAYRALIDLLSNTSGNAHRMTTEALGSLPHGIGNTQSPNLDIEHLPEIAWPALLGKTGLNTSSSIDFFGRSLVTGPVQQDQIMVLKFARAHENPEGLLLEALWMDKLQRYEIRLPFRFDVPKPFKISGSYISRLKDCPSQVYIRKDLHPERYFICFFVHKEYFRYPNLHEGNGYSGPDEYIEVMTRNAKIMANLASIGVIHAAPIPLFHNRVERQRRRDLGLYEWYRGGRLDRWLESCSYPNIGYTGLRDFEHFIAFNGPNQHLYRHLGTHFLSLLLLCGSYFRNKDKGKIGLDKDGKPYDTRELFDRNLLQEVISKIFENYYREFTGEKYSDKLPIDLDTLTKRMIDEMGVDNHMKEILRAVDQQEMSDDIFEDFLLKRGFSKEKISRLEKGAKDISVNSGPHLGAFNDKISLPELIDAVGSMSALCISGRFMKKY